MLRRRFKSVFDAVVGALAIATINIIHWFDRKRTANFSGALMRKVGPMFKEHRLGREQLRAAFPEKSDAEIETILTGVWDNLGRVSVEFAHLDDFGVEGFEPRKADQIIYDLETRARFDRVAKSGKATIAFAAHIANWELPGVAAKLTGLKTAALFRRPNIGTLSDAVIKLRQPLMGELVATSFDAPLKLARMLEAGIHVGMLADQHYTKGVEVTFFGRRCLANPLVAQLARQTECPIHGIRLVRQPDGNSFWGEFTEAIDPVRDADGRIAIAGTTQKITSVIEGWVREHPEQWLWLHRRWR
ncbi:MAG: lipid A biosynthesis lauroyl acyltransferase [Xanthobacteraceae bacterium]|jgi:KDO2-lipid IV(A) lauroyltransferase